MWGQLGFVKHRKTGTFHVSRADLRKRKQLGLARTISTAISLTFGGFMVYCSMHYAGAFVNVGRIVGLTSSSTSNVALQDLQKQTGFFEPVKKHFRLNRVYLRAGQGIQTQYALPRGTKATIHIQKCKSFPVVEVFACDFVSHESRRLTSDKGRSEFFVSEPGFYYFTEDIKLPASAKNKDYYLIWRRV